MHRLMKQRTYQCKILIVPEEGWFGQPKYSTPTKKNPSTLCRLLLLFSSKNIDFYYILCVDISVMSNGNRTEWSPIRSVITRVMTKSDDRAAGVRFVYHEYDYRPNGTTLSPIIN